MHPEKRVVWHPRHDDRFVVGGGTQITLYELTKNNEQHPEIRHVSSRHDLHHMRCFAWSPEPRFNDLIAVGTTTGRVDLIRLQASARSHSKSSVLSAGPTVPLAVRNSRACNALAFSTADPNYLAVGLDKVRGDPSLVIWDLTSTRPLLQIPGESWSHHLHTIPAHLAIPRAIEPQHHSRTDPRILQQHAPTEVVSALSFVPNTTHLLLAGISNRWLRFFDLRAPTPSKVQGIAADPLEPHRIACWGGDEGVVSIWDARKLVQPVLIFSERDAGADGGGWVAGGAGAGGTGVYVQAEWASIRRGTLATLERDSRFVRVWDVLSARPYVVEGEGSSSGTRAGAGSGAGGSGGAWYQPMYSPFGPGSGTEAYGTSWNSSVTLVLSNTRRSKSFPRVLSSFALLPSTPSFSNGMGISSKIMVVNKEGDLELYAMHDGPKQVAWSARGDLAISGGRTFKLVTGSQLGDAGDVGTTMLRDKMEGLGVVSKRTADGGQRPAFSRTASSSHGAGALTTLAMLSRRVSGQEAKEKEKEKERAGWRSDAKRKEIMLTRVVQEDISMVMKQRAVKGYGIGRPQHNALVIRDVDDGHGSTEMLSDLWLWIRHSQDLLSTPTSLINEYDFAYQGLSAIWEGFPPTPSTPMTMYVPVHAHANAARVVAAAARQLYSHSHPSSASQSYTQNGQSDYQAALSVLVKRINKNMGGSDAADAWRPPVASHKLLQRQVALQLCGWSVREDDLMGAIRRWEKEGAYPRAACWLVFMKQYDKAVELLMRSNDESHRMMSGTLAALLPSVLLGSSPPSAKNEELRQHCERLIVRLHDPYFRVLLTHLMLGDWSEVLEEDSLPFRERLAIAFQFLSDRSLSSYLKRSVEQATVRGDIDSVIVTGLRCRAGMDILQKYIDRTGDVQSVAILSALAWPSRQQQLDTRPERWLEAYRDLLDGFRLFDCRVGFDIERGQVMNAAIQNGEVGAGEWVPGQIMIRCRDCGKTVNGPGVGPTLCPHCNRQLPRCSICLMPLEIVRDASRVLGESGHVHKDTIDDAIVICQTCRHGGHASHIMAWYWTEDGKRNHETCAVADCQCRCADEF
ncbi:hypothetical protein AMATHDRAFT_137028 [Amanita thiersii Skay4041]|uniref:Uncharacterized protein n=1 Tax=Amanita thiersii Skay4041 TaxID=703135 RepID=A0A2A9NU77_9AGAR|nr:hypothetical protein AMATHDRAFT_137028 [Amanita thiersii Skay4041]